MSVQPMYPGRSQGFVLVTALIFLALILLLGLAASRGSQMLNAVAANERAASMAESGANAALRRAEKRLFDFYKVANGRALVGDTTASLGVYSAEAAAANPSFAAFITPQRWSVTGATKVPGSEVDFTGADATARLAQQPVYMIEDLGPARPSGAGSARESGATGGANYFGSSGMSGGNATLRVYRITAKSTGPNGQLVKTLQSVYAGHAGS
ncbi:PilX N-terminal domain-containing pilus assembly protein [Tahibacter sp. UC22_41]|uniref:pilus assembly PilX family protein n=1 Tax=Tahibacter sp. UC22_41 TaxID=3350178 RepID=UPI0036DE0977